MSGAVVALKTKKPVSFGDVLAQTAKAPEPKAKKSTMLTLAPPPEVAKAVDEYQDAKTNMKQAEASMDAAGETITDFVRNKQDADGFAGRYQGSYAVKGNKHTVKVIYANKFSLNPQDEAELAAILGESYPEMVVKSHTVTLKAEVFENKELQAELMELVGDRFADFFETSTKLNVAEGFAQAVYQIVNQEDLPALRTFARQYKPSIR